MSEAQPAAQAIAAIVLHPADDVAVAIEELAKGRVVDVGGETIAVTERIPAGHKFARRSIRRGQDLRKYGEVIGHTTSDISIGEHVHVHNLVGNRLGVDA